jgi:hypothetical protein
MAADGRPAATGSHRETQARRTDGCVSREVAPGERQREASAHLTVLGIVSGLTAFLLLSLLFINPIRAEAGTETQTYGEEVIPPESRHLLDVDWCKAWIFGCYSCTKEGGKINCIARSNDCSRYTKNFIFCTAFNPGATCTKWTDGCNTCLKSMFSHEYSCTAAACPGLVPTFQCLQRFF